MGWKWYRLPLHPSRRDEKPYRALFLPSIHEEGQSPEWTVAADGTERVCSMDYMEREGLLPPFDTSMDAAMQLVERMRERGWYFALSDETAGYHCAFYKDLETIIFAKDPSPARAVCLAFVAARNS